MGLRITGVAFKARPNEERRRHARVHHLVVGVKLWRLLGLKESPRLQGLPERDATEEAC